MMFTDPAASVIRLVALHRCDVLKKKKIARMCLVLPYLSNRLGNNIKFLIYIGWSMVFTVQLWCVDAMPTHTRTHTSPKVWAVIETIVKVKLARAHTICACTINLLLPLTDGPNLAVRTEAHYLSSTCGGCVRETKRKTDSEIWSAQRFIAIKKTIKKIVSATPFHWQFGLSDMGLRYAIGKAKAHKKE